MDIALARMKFGDKSTIGEFWYNGKFLCYSLEPALGDGGKGYAIPAGCYRVTLVTSPKFKRTVPLLHDVPGRTAIEIHPGNTHADTKGCILPGMEYLGIDRIGRSREAFEMLVGLMAKAGEDVYISIVNNQAAKQGGLFVEEEKA